MARKIALHKRTADRIVRDGATLMNDRKYSPKDVRNWLVMQYDAAMKQQEARRRG